MDILRAILDGIAMAAIFNGAAAALALVSPRYFLDSYPKGIQKAAPKKMTESEKHVNGVFSIIVMGTCIIYELISNYHMGATGFGQLFLAGYINWILVNFGDFFLLDCLLILGVCKDKMIIPGTEGHPDYEAKNWMKHLALPEHFILWPFIIVPFIAVAQAGIILLIRMFFG